MMLFKKKTGVQLIFVFNRVADNKVLPSLKLPLLASNTDANKWTCDRPWPTEFPMRPGGLPVWEDAQPTACAFCLSVQHLDLPWGICVFGSFLQMHLLFMLA
jgi:hypothetical protein